MTNSFQALPLMFASRVYFECTVSSRINARGGNTAHTLVSYLFDPHVRLKISVSRLGILQQDRTTPTTSSMRYHGSCLIFVLNVSHSTYMW